jgi:hypothetical protein
MSALSVDPAHFARAVSDLGDKRPVVARSAIVNAQGLKIIDCGVAIDARLYDRLAQHQLRLPLAECLASEPLLDGATLRSEVLGLCAQEPLFGAMRGIGRLSALPSEELALVPLPQALAFELPLLRESRPMAWRHALRRRGGLAGASAGRHATRSAHARHRRPGARPGHAAPRPRAGAARDGSLQRAAPTALYAPAAPAGDGDAAGAPSSDCARVAARGAGAPRAIGPWGRILALAEGISAVPVARLSLALGLDRRRFDPLLRQELLALLPAARLPAASGSGHDLVEEMQALALQLERWPAVAPAGMLKADGVPAVHAQAAQILRQMAEAGVAPSQLAALDPDGADGALRAELQAILREMAWQLRTLLRLAQRRWRLGDGERPEWLGAWMAEAEALCARQLSGWPGRRPSVVVSAAPATPPSPSR